MSEDEVVFFEKEDDEEIDYEYEIPLRVSILKDDEIIYSHPFVNLAKDHEKMDRKLKDTVSKFLMNNIYHVLFKNSLDSILTV